jgi:hypothetical protein
VTGSGSEVFTPSPPPQRINVAGDPLSGFGSLTEFHQCATVRDRFPDSRRRFHTAHPFRGFFPFNVFPAARSHIHPVSFHLTGYVAPLGFRNPSTLYSPHDLPSLFHPGPAHGVYPSGSFSPRNAVRPLGRRDPHAVGYDVNAAPPPQGFAHSGDPALGSWGLAKRPAGYPRGFVPLQGFLLDPPDTNQ